MTIRKQIGRSCILELLPSLRSSVPDFVLSPLPGLLPFLPSPPSFLSVLISLSSFVRSFHPPLSGRLPSLPSSPPSFLCSWTYLRPVFLPSLPFYLAFLPSLPALLSSCLSALLPSCLPAFLPGIIPFLPFFLLSLT
jgi:hypothetical protein